MTTSNETTPNDIDAQIAALQAAKKQALLENEKAAKAALNAVVPEWEWQTKWYDDYNVRISCRRSAAYLAALEAIRQEFSLDQKAPRCLTFLLSRDNPAAWMGMDHILIENHLLTVGGGCVITNLDRQDTFRPVPRILTDDVAAELRAGGVPESIRAPWAH